MNTFKRFFILILSSCVLMTGCEKSTKEPAEQASVLDVATIEIRQNDYRGGVIRTYALQSNVLNIMEGMKRNNIVIREDNPNSYWTTNGYQDFVSTFLTSPIINDTQWFNEEETDWNTLVTQMASVPNSFTQTSDDGYTFKSGISVERNEKDDYSISGTTETIGSLSGKSVYRILYDCDKDWCKAYTTIEVTGTGADNITGQMFEYARINNDTFAIQTAKERLLVVLEPTDTDTDLRVRPIKEFYYSRLSGGQRTTFKPYEPLPEEEEDGTPLLENKRENELRAKYPLLNEHGEVATQYGVKNSIFTQENVGETNYPWVFEDGALQQAIVYKQNTLVVTTYNKLSEKYERFIYSTEKVDNKLVTEIESMVNIEGLVGVIEVNKSEDVPTTADEEPASTQTAEAATTENIQDTAATTPATTASTGQPSESTPVVSEPNNTNESENPSLPQTTEVLTDNSSQEHTPFVPTPNTPIMNQEAGGTT